MKRKVLAVAVAVLIAALITTGAYAFFTKGSTATNVITAGNIDFAIQEITDSGEAFPVHGVQVMPGDTVSKIVTVKNTGTNPLYLRLKLTVGVLNDDTLSAEDKLSMDLNTTDWTLGQDGFYYYNKALEPDAVTEPIFTKVTVDGESVGNEYLGKSFTLTVAGAAVQSENNGTDVFDAVGWPAEKTVDD